MSGAIRKRSNSGQRKRSSNRLMAEINVTPFVDVMLVLLIIFMVAAPLLTVGISVELPKTAATPLPNEQEEPLTITLTGTGVIWLQKTEIKFDELNNKLKSILVERSNDKIFLRADGANSYETVMKLMGALNNAGFNNIGLVTDTGGPAFTGGF
jgi:biopolymer transport protein TolR